MIALAFVIEEHGPDLTKRTHARLVRDTLRHMASRHVRETLGKHFRVNPETSPGGAYGYRRRTKRYEQRKRRKRGHNRPNEYSGRTKRHIRNTAKITATQHRARMRLRAPFPMPKWQRDEIQAITPGERAEAVQAGAEHYTREARKPSNRRKRRRRVS